MWTCSKVFFCFFGVLFIVSCSSKLVKEKPLLIAELREQRLETDHAMVATAHPLATNAGKDMLERGGNAVDAAVASAFVLGVVEPMMSGIGGGGSMTIWMKKTTEARHVEFYASAGADSGKAGPATPDSLFTAEQEVAIPGTVAGLLGAHERYGRLSRREVMAPAINVARKGFEVHPLLARIVESQEEKLSVDSTAFSIFYPGGEAIRAGEKLVQESLANTLEEISKKGKQGFYEGKIADDLISRLKKGGSPITSEDLKNFEPRWRNPLLADYKGYTILAAPPPMGGLEVTEMLNLLEAYNFPSLGYPASSPEVLSKLTDAIRLARADRYAWNGDPRDKGVPATAISSDDFASKRSSLIGIAVPDSIFAGDPWRYVRDEKSVQIGAIPGFPYTDFSKPESIFLDDRSEDTTNTQTTHLSIVDEERNAVTLTFTMGQYFGSGVFSNGAFYNTAARNFGDVYANEWGPYRTPRSSTAPTMVLKGSDVQLVVGSPGSGRIPPAIVQMIVYILDYGMDPLDAIYMPRLYPYISSKTVLIEDGFKTGALKKLTERGYKLEILPAYDTYFGGVHLVFVTEKGTLIGVADPRRNGSVSGF